MNRQQKRQAMKAIPAYRRGTSAEELIRKMSKNGITVEQYDTARQREYERGFSEGVRAGREETIKMAYAAICLAANRLHGFGQKRCMDLLTAVDDNIVNHLHSSEAIDEVFQDVGIQIDFHDAVGPIKAVG